MPSPFETDIFRMSENVLDDRRRSANAIRPCTDNFRRSRSIGPENGGSTGNDSDDLLFDICSLSTSFSSVMVGVNWFLPLDFSSGVRSMVSGVIGVVWLSSSGSDMQIRFTDKLSGLIDFGISSVDVFWMGIQVNSFYFHAKFMKRIDFVRQYFQEPRSHLGFVICYPRSVMSFTCSRGSLILEHILNCIWP